MVLKPCLPPAEGSTSWTSVQTQPPSPLSPRLELVLSHWAPEQGHLPTIAQGRLVLRLDGLPQKQSSSKLSNMACPLPKKPRLCYRFVASKISPTQEVLTRTGFPFWCPSSPTSTFLAGPTPSERASQQDSVLEGLKRSGLSLKKVEIPFLLQQTLGFKASGRARRPPIPPPCTRPRFLRSHPQSWERIWHLQPES
jgi:hypothetical protein